MTLNRRNILYGLFGFGLSLVGASCNDNSSRTKPAGTKSGQVPEKIRVGYQVYAGSEMLAKGAGLVKEAFPNSKVEYLRFDSGRDVNTAFAANSIDIGVLGSAAMAVGLSSSIPYEVFYVYDLTDKAEALVAKNGIEKVADLKGKKIATTFSSTSHYSLLSLLELEKVQQNELTLLDMLPQDILAAWQRGNIDGAYTWEPVLANIEREGGKVLATSGEVGKRGHATLTVAVVSQQFAQQYPGAVKQYISALDKAVKLYRQNPDAAGKAIAAELGVPPQEALRQAGNVTWYDASQQTTPQNLGTVDKVGDIARVLKQTADFLVAQKTVPSAPDLATIQKHVFHAPS